MKVLLKILIVACLCCMANGAGAIAGKTGEEMYLFTDRSFCASGDTVWVMLKLPPAHNESGVVARFQINAVDGRLIKSIAVESSDGWASGYLPVPDSLSTGQYFVTGNLLVWNSNFVIRPVTHALYVFNRFDENVEQLAVLPMADSKITDDIFEITTDSEAFNTRTDVTVKLEKMENTEVQEVLISASLVNQLEEDFESTAFEYRQPKQPAVGFSEKGGYLISGRVTNIAGIIQPRALVILTITGQNSYFDYAVTDSAGMFHFFLKNAKGNSSIFFMVYPSVNQKCEVTLETGNIQIIPKSEAQIKILTARQTAFAENIISSSFAHKMFYPQLNMPKDTFSMFLSDKTPFYGLPAFRVYPVDFIDLPDFREISRELLHGFQYRVHNDEITFRMLNKPRNQFFEYEPLRMLNGIPVFDNQLFAGLKSTDISHIDLVQSERVYGDLILNGVIEVALKDKSNAWIENQPNVFRIPVSFIQPSKVPSYVTKLLLKPNEPDTRQVFLWHKTNRVPENFNFILSDRKGEVKITIEGFTVDNRYFKSSKTITVK